MVLPVYTILDNSFLEIFGLFKAALISSSSSKTSWKANRPWYPFRQFSQPFGLASQSFSTSICINFLNTFFSYGVVSLLNLQWGHNILASLCEIIPVKAVDNKYLSTFISSNLSTVDRALLVWIVDKTKCPVIDARTAIWAVSESRISPIKIILGSCLNIERSAAAKVIPISALTWTWLIPSIFISIGSSTVIIFFSGLLSSCSIE